MSAPTVRNVTAVTGTPAGGGTVTVTTPTNVAGDLLVLQIIGTPTSAADPTATGYSKYAPSSGSGTSGSVFLLTHTSSGSEPSTFNVTFPTAGTYDIFCYALIGAGAPNAGVTALTVSGATNTSTMSLTTTSIDSLIIAGFRATTGTVSVSSPLASPTLIGKSVSAIETQATIGTYSLRGNSSGSGNWTDTSTAFPGSTLSVWAPNVAQYAASWDSQPALENITLSFRFGGLPNAGVTPSSVRSVQMGYTDDVFSNQVPATSVLLLGGRPNSPVTPRTLRQPLYVPAEDTLSYQVPPAVGVLHGGKANKAVTPPTLRVPLCAQTDDTLSNQVPPTGTILLGKLFTLARKSTPIIQGSTDDTLSYQTPPARSTVLGGLGHKGGIPPTLRQVLVAQTEDTLSHQVPPTGRVTRTTPASPPISAGLRNLTTGSQEDIVSYREPPAQSYLFGGESTASVTPPTLRPVLFVPAEDTFSKETIISHFFGGKPNTHVTPPTLRIPIREPIIVGVEELLLGRPAECYLFGGRPNRPVTPPFVGIPPSQRPQQAVGPEDVFSWQRHPEGQVLGGRANARVQPAQMRPVVVAGTEDSLSWQRQAEGVIKFGPAPNRLGGYRPPLVGIPPDSTPSYARPGEVEVLSDKQVFQPYGGKPPRAVTPQTLRAPVVVVAEDVLSLQRPGESVLLGGKPNQPITPPTLRQPIIVPINVLSQDALSVQRPAEFLRFGGTPKPPVVGLRQPITLRAEDNLSFASPPTAYLYGGRPNKRVTPPYPAYRSLIVVPAEDVISQQSSYLTAGAASNANAFSLVMGGRPSRAVTPPPGPRLLVLGNTDDTLSNEPLKITILQGARFVVIGKPPPTPINDAYIPTLNVRGSG